MGDFNSHIKEYLSDETDEGGDMLLNMAAAWGLSIANNRDEFTFVRARGEGMFKTILDWTLV